MRGRLLTFVLGTLFVCEAGGCGAWGGDATAQPLLSDTPPPRMPRTATFSALGSFSGSYGKYAPWSPTKPLIAYITKSGLSVFDAANPSVPPVEVYQGRVDEYTWSPDGDWLVFKTVSIGWPSKPLVALIAVPATGGAPCTLIDGAVVHDFVWATNGNIYYWQLGSETWTPIAPPASWPKGQYTGRPVLLFASTPATRQTKSSRQPYYFYTGLPVQAGLSGYGTFVRSVDGFPDGRLLIRVFAPDESGAGGNLIVDAQGTLLGRVDPSGGAAEFDGASVSSDGSFVAGHEETGDGHFTLSAKLFVVDTNNAWRLQVEGVEWGLDPRLSRVGSFLAYMGKSGETRIGALSFAD